MKFARSLSMMALASFATAGAQAALGDTATYLFNLPSTSVASQSPPYPLVATLTLTEVSGGVDFLLTPNWLDSTTGFSDPSFIERLDYVYKGPADPTMTWLAGAQIDTFTYETNQNNLDSGYKTDDQHIRIDWFTGNNDTNRFERTATSSWNVSGVLTDFTDTQATSGPKPTPMFGVISVTAYSLEDPKPTPSNWVAMQVPEPETYALMLAGLAAIGFVARRRKTA